MRFNLLIVRLFKANKAMLTSIYHEGLMVIEHTLPLINLCTHANNLYFEAKFNIK